MSQKSTLVLGLIIAFVLLLNMMAFQVRFNEAAVVTTFGRAGDNSVLNAPEANGSGVGLNVKWPWPIQDVRRYDTRVQILEDQPEQQQTKDAFSVIVNSYLAWRIAKPLDFFRALQNEPAAEAQLLSRLRDAKSIIGEYTFDELSNPDQSKLKLQEIEKGILKRLQDQIDVQKYGIKIEAVGIKRIALPEEVTKKVFARMRATRERLAQRARSEGDAVANGIRSQAQSSADRILAFAKLRAEAIRGEGDLAAAKYYEVFRQNPSFAAYRLQIETLKQTLQHNTTFLLDTQTPPFDLFKLDEKTAPKRAE